VTSMHPCCASDVAVAHGHIYPIIIHELGDFEAWILRLGSKEHCGRINSCSAACSFAGMAVKIVDEWFVLIKLGVFEVFEVMIRQMARALIQGPSNLRRALGSLHENTSAIKLVMSLDIHTALSLQSVVQYRHHHCLVATTSSGLKLKSQVIAPDAPLVLNISTEMFPRQNSHIVATADPCYADSRHLLGNVLRVSCTTP
jgi:hypothetical protein